MAGGLDVATIQRVVRRSHSRIQHCYRSLGLKDKPQLKGTVKVSWTITSKGNVGLVQIMTSTLNHAATETCLTKAIRRLRFPRPKGAMPYITYPFHFKPKGG